MLEKYFKRIGLEDVLPSVDLPTLQKIHTAHLLHIPFENLGIHLKEGISLAHESLVKKLIGDQRGGYCFENNLLSYEVLKNLGFDVRLRGARVIAGQGIMPMTHLVLEVHLQNQRWLYDVGFGGNGIKLPQKMNGEVQNQQFYQARVRDAGSEWILEKKQKSHPDWIPVYAIQKIDFHYIDCVVANHYTSTHTESIFTKTITVQKFFTDSRIIYRKSDGLKRTILTEEQEVTTEVSAEEALNDIEQRFLFKKEFLPKLRSLIF